MNENRLQRRPYLGLMMSNGLVLLLLGGSAIWVIGCKPVPPIPQSGLQLWLRADAGITLDGSTVSRWKDQSGHENDAIQLDTARQPLFMDNALNGKPVLRFDGDNDKLGLTGSQRMSQLSLFIVFKIDSGAMGPNPNYLIILGDVPGDGQVYYVEMQDQPSRYSSDSIYIGAGLFSGVEATAPRCAAFGQWSSVSIQTNHTMWDTRMRANGVDATIMRQWNNMLISVPLGNSAANGAGGIAGNDVARLPGGRVVAKCDIAEVILYDTVLSDALRRSVEQYLAAKYALPLMVEAGR